MNNKPKPARIQKLDMHKMEQFEMYAQLLSASDQDQSAARLFLSDMIEYQEKMAKWTKEHPQAMRIAEYANTLGLNDQNICDYYNWKNNMPLGPEW